MKLARRNLEWAGVGENVELHNRDVAEGFAVTGADALFLDVRTPWEYLDHDITLPVDPALRVQSPFILPFSAE